MAIKDYRWIWTENKYSIVHTPIIFMIIAKMVMFIGSIPMTLSF